MHAPDSNDMARHLSFIRGILPALLLLLVWPASAELWLTDAERAWVAEHPTVVLGTEHGIEPAVIIHENGTIEGAVPDLLNLIGEVTGLTFRLKPLEPGRHLQPGLPPGVHGFVPSTPWSISLHQDRSLTRAIWNTMPVIFTRADDAGKIGQVSDLAGLRVAHLAHTATMARYLASIKPNSEIIKVPSVVEGFTLLLENRIDAYVGISTDSYQLSNYLIPNIKVALVDTKTPIEAGIAITDRHPLLLSILNKAIDRVGDKLISEVSGKWLDSKPPRHIQRDFLSRQQRRWLRAHPKITLGFIENYEPWLINEKGEKSGILVDLANEIASRLDIEIDIVTGPWKILSEQVESREIDGLLLLIDDFAEQLELTPTEATFYHSRIFYAKTDSGISIREPEDLAGKKIVYYSTTTPDNPLIAPIKDKVTLVKTGSAIEGLSALISGKGDLFAGYSSDNYVIEYKNIPNIKPIYLETDPEKISLSVRNDWPELASIINLTIAQMGAEKLLNIQRRWLKLPDIVNTTLTPIESEYLKKLQVLRYDHRTDFAPISFVDQRGQPAGIIVDYIQLLEEKTGLKIEAVINSNQKDSLKMIGEHWTDICMILANIPEKQRGFLAFSEPFQSIPYVLIAKNDVPIIKNIEELQGRTIGVIDNSLAQKILQKHYSDKIVLKTFSSIKNGMKALKEDKIFALVENEIVMDYSLRSLDTHDLKFSGTLPFSYSPSISVREDMAQLIPIFNKILSGMSEREHALIYKRWANFPVEKKVSWAKLAGWISIIAVIVILILATILYWNRKLLAARIEAEQANQAKSLFLANMSHEIRTPMNAILGFAEIIQQDSSLSEEHKHSLSVIRNAGNHLLSLINDILDISKIEAGRTVVTESACRLQKMLHDLEQMFVISAEQKGLSLTIDHIDNLPEVIITDEGKLRQILINLIGNAIKFTQQGRIHCSCESQIIEEEKLEITIHVHDTGPGIDNADKDKVFSTFEQTKTGIKTEGGTGLGMAISKAYARLMGGDITFTTEPGKGSCFTFSFVGTTSLMIIDDTDYQSISQLEFKDKPLRILVVDDNQTNRKLAKSILKPMGFIVSEAVDGRDALRQFSLTHPDAVLMDIRMPEMDGQQATRLIRESDTDTPIIAMTAGVLDKDPESFWETGFTDVLDKPFKRDDLLLMLARRLDLQIGDSAADTQGQLSEPIPQVRDQTRVLIVDDVAVNRVLLDKLLDSATCVTRHSENGREAMEQIKTWHPRLVLLDIQMPVMDGYDVLHQVQQLPEEQRPCVVAITAANTLEEENSLLSLGASAVYTKPFSGDKLDDLLSKLSIH